MKLLKNSVFIVLIVTIVICVYFLYTTLIYVSPTTSSPTMSTLDTTTQRPTTSSPTMSTLDTTTQRPTTSSPTMSTLDTTTQRPTRGRHRSSNRSVYDSGLDNSFSYQLPNKWINNIGDINEDGDFIPRSNSLAQYRSNLSATLAPGKCNSHRRCGHLSGKYCHEDSICKDCPDTLDELNTFIREKNSIDNNWPYTCDSLELIDGHSRQQDGLGMECSEDNGCRDSLFCYKHSTSKTNGRCLRCTNCETHGKNNYIGEECTKQCDAE